MSTYYELRCDQHDEQGGFFSRQMWGWGNADVIENTKFLMAHASCRAITIVCEDDNGYGDEAATQRWSANWRDGEARNMWPHDAWDRYAAAEDLWDCWMQLKAKEEAAIMKAKQ